MQLTVKNNGREMRLGLFLERKLRGITVAATRVIPKEAYDIFQQTIASKQGWGRPTSYPESADLDMEKASSGANDFHSDSIYEAILSDLRRGGPQSGKTSFGIGDIRFLLRSSPRILYYEFGTLGFQENTSKLGIADFSSWKPNRISYSKLRNAIGPGAAWGFLEKEGVGRFGKGIMVPARKGIEPFKGIHPVRMYRGAAKIAFNKIVQNQKAIVTKVMSESKRIY